MKNNYNISTFNELVIYNDFIPHQTNGYLHTNNDNKKTLPEILIITSYPKRECGIATYSYDLLKAISNVYGNTFSLKICALETTKVDHVYPEEVKYVLQTSAIEQYDLLARKIKEDKNLLLVFVQHEFGLFGGECGDYLLPFLALINKPVITCFHTILPNGDDYRKKVIQTIASLSTSVIVMTNHASNILKNNYEIEPEKITIIPHGTHATPPILKRDLKIKKQLSDRIVLSTFGLLSSNKNIEIALDALPEIIKQFPNLVYLVIGKTHPEVSKVDGEIYRNYLLEKVTALDLQSHVKFINKYLPLDELLEYLQLTDLYLFTSKDPNQSVSGTLAYAMASGCPVVSTPIPHALEVLNKSGEIVDFNDAHQLATTTINLLSNPVLLKQMRLNALHKISSTIWPNSAIAHVELLLKSINKKEVKIKYKLPKISLDHIKRMSTNTGIIQFANISSPDMQSGYTLDDNARALIATIKYYAITGDTDDLYLIDLYLNFIRFCQQPNGSFLNYVDVKLNFLDKNRNENLEDANGRAIWALGEFIGNSNLFSDYYINKAEKTILKSLAVIEKFKSPRAIAFAIKGLHYYNQYASSNEINLLITKLADNLVSKFRGVSDAKWQWFEEYLTYANSVLPEAMLCAFLSTGNLLYKDISKTSFDFLLSIIFNNNKIKVVSNKGWHYKGITSNQFGEQPIDVAYTILALDQFYTTFKDPSYKIKIKSAFNWFLGDNHIHQVMYNSVTGGCYDGLEELHVNLNQGAESTISYLLSRFTIEKYNKIEEKNRETESYINYNALQLIN